jgi:hypothetical protein
MGGTEPTFGALWNNENALRPRLTAQVQPVELAFVTVVDRIAPRFSPA